MRTLTFGLLWLLTAGQAAAELSVDLSRAEVAAGEAVVLTLTQTGPQITPPDLTPLEADFHIVDRARRTEVTVVNGQRTERRELLLTLLPRRTGSLTVPALSAGDDSTGPLHLDVGPTTAGDSRLLPQPTGVASAPSPAVFAGEIAIDAEVSPPRARVGEQVLLVVEVSSEDGPPQGRLHDPQLGNGRLLPLGEERRVEDRDAGERYIYERRYAIFPAEPGPLEIQPLRYDSWTPGAGTPQTELSPALRVSVLPIPELPDDRSWLPARSVTLSEAGPSAVRLAPGQALERSLTLSAVGLAAEDLPEIPLAIPFQLRVRDDAPRLWNERRPDGVIGHRTERILISAAEPGRYVLKSPGLPWWNTETERWETASLPDWELIVAALDSADRRLAPSWTPPTLESAPESPVEPRAPIRAPEPRRGIWIVILATVLALVALLWLWLRRRARRGGSLPDQLSAYAPKEAAGVPPATEDEASAADPLDQAIAAVTAAYDSGNATRARSALLAWAVLIWPDDPPANLARLALRLPSPLSDRVKLLEKSFFSPTPIDWSSQPVTPLLHEIAAPQQGTAGGAQP